jgi:hypothetical protein
MSFRIDEAREYVLSLHIDGPLGRRQSFRFTEGNDLARLHRDTVAVDTA